MKREKIRITTDRIEFFSDAVIAIIITLMILEIKLPKIEGATSTWDVIHQLACLWPNLFAFIISFAILAVFWVNHHQFYKAVDRSDWKLLWYNMHFLFWCSLIPLSTALLAEHYDIPFINALYGLNLLLAGGAFALMSGHARRRELFIENLTSKIHKKIKLINFISIMMYVIAIFAGYISVYISLALFAIAPILHFFPQEVELETHGTTAP